MRLRWIALQGFRSYRELEWQPEEGINLLVGPNGAGKTNLLEAIGYLASLTSFRGAPDEALVSDGEEAGVVRGEVESVDSTTLLEVEIRRRGGRRTLVNRQRLGRVADLLGVVRAVVFLPDDLDLVKRGPAYRRELLDSTAVQLWPGAYLDQAEYDRALRQRNAFLKRGEDDPVTLGVWDERLAQAGGKVMTRRARTASELTPRVGESYREVAGEAVSVEIGYRSEWGGGLDPAVPAAEWSARLLDGLRSARRADVERRLTTVGPHRDEPVLMLDGHDLRYHGSQGEQRTMALSLRLAAHRAVSDQTPSPPLLLLDDVFSELDPKRSAALAAALPPAQCFVTSADRSEVPLQGRTWTISEGVVR